MLSSGEVGETPQQRDLLLNEFWQSLNKGPNPTLPLAQPPPVALSFPPVDPRLPQLRQPTQQQPNNAEATMRILLNSVQPQNLNLFKLHNQQTGTENALHLIAQMLHTHNLNSIQNNLPNVIDNNQEIGQVLVKPEPQQQQKQESTADQLRKTQDLEIEETLLSRLEREFAEERREANSYEVKMNASHDEAERLKKQIKDLEASVRLKKIQIDKVEKEEKDWETMWKYLRGRLEKKREGVREKTGKIESLKKALKNGDSRDGRNVDSRNDDRDKRVDDRDKRVDDRDKRVDDRDKRNDDRDRNDDFLTRDRRTSSTRRNSERTSDHHHHSNHHNNNNNSNNAFSSSSDNILTIRERESSNKIRRESSTTDLPSLKRPTRETSPGPLSATSRQTVLTIVERETATAPSQAPTITTSGFCYAFNNDESCNRSACTASHTCIMCGGNHSMTACSKERNICVKHNMEECPGSCYREHRCLRCGEKNHRLVECSVPPSAGVEFCFAWNCSFNCKVVSCHRVHRCIRCKGNHAVLHCPENVLVYWNESQGSQGVSSNSSKISGSGLSIITNGNKNSSSNSSLNSAFSAGSLSTPTDIKVVERKQSFNSGGGGSSSGQLSARGDDLLSLLDDRVSKKPRRESVDERLGPRRMGDTDRRLVCRDWNNGKCNEAREKCKFRHICMRCGTRDHKERQCPSPQID